MTDHDVSAPHRGDELEQLRARVAALEAQAAEHARTSQRLRLEEMRLNSLLELNQKASELSQREIIQLTMEEAVRLTQSRIGYLHFVNLDQESIELYTWSYETLEHCTAVHESHYPLSQAGVWADSARLKTPVVHNDYQSLPHRKGYPEGHSHLVRHASIPIMDGNKVALVLGVGNKAGDYNEADVRQLLLTGDNLWKIIRRKRLEQELREHVRALEEADRHKDEFLAMLAHELRNPLAPIRDAVEILGMPQAPAEAVQRARQILRRQLDHLIRLVDDLLDVSRTTGGKIELQCRPVSLADVATNAVEINRALIESCRHELSIELGEPPAWVHGDPVRLVQVAANLLNNAAKFTPSGGRIRLVVEREGEEAVIRVCDNGQGIPAKILPRVFDLFVQADRPLDRSQGGLGLGLTVARTLTEMHGGRVEARSSGAGQGSEFVVRLPAIAAQAAPGDPAGDVPAAPAESAGGRILVVDDNPDAATLLAEVLRSFGYEAAIVADGPAALEAARSFRPQAALVDIGLPGMDGYEVARRLRREHVEPPMLLLAVTGYSDREALERSREAGFDHHLVKPVPLDTLLDLLAAHARRVAQRIGE